MNITFFFLAFLIYLSFDVQDTLCVLQQADPAQALNVPVVPLGALMSAAYPLACRPPYVLSWLNPQVSARDMMLPEMFERLILNNFCKCF